MPCQEKNKQNQYVDFEQSSIETNLYQTVAFFINLFQKTQLLQHSDERLDILFTDLIELKDDNQCR